MIFTTTNLVKKKNLSLTDLTLQTAEQQIKVRLKFCRNFLPKCYINLGGLDF